MQNIDQGTINLIGDIQELLKKSANLEFHDFATELATPKVDLRNIFLGLAQSVVDGRYDNDPITK